MLFQKLLLELLVLLLDQLRLVPADVLDDLVWRLSQNAEPIADELPSHYLAILILHLGRMLSVSCIILFLRRGEV